MQFYEKMPTFFFSTDRQLTHTEAINYIIKHSDRIEEKLELIGKEFLIHAYKRIDIIFRKDDRLILIEVKNRGSTSQGKRQLLSYKRLLERFKPLFIKNYKFEFIVVKCGKLGLRGYKFFDEHAMLFNMASNQLMPIERKKAIENRKKVGYKKWRNL